MNTNMLWQCGTRRISLDRPLIMGILNVTPDSFSDGYPTLDRALTQARKLVEEGADILDIGGESARPGADPVTEAVETDRVVPVIAALAKEEDVLLSIDTQKPGVARAALAAGAHIVNHVSASLDFAAMIPVLAASGAGYVAMHMPDRPKTMQQSIAYEDVVEQVSQALNEVGKACKQAGIARECLLFDPGIGFGKTLQHNLELMNHVETISDKLGRPLLMGISRKSWLVNLMEDSLPDMAERDAYTMLASTQMPFPAVAVHRVHNAAYLSRAFRLLGSL